MGHSTATWQVTPEELATYEKEDKRSQSSSIYSYYRQTLADKILSIGVQSWYDEEAGRYDDARTGTAVMLPVTPMELADDLDVDRHGNDTESMVMPIMDKRDYTIATKTMTIKLDDAEWKRLASHSWSVVEEKVLEMDPSLKGMVSKVTVKLPEGEKTNPWDTSKGWKIISSIEADTSGGKTKTVYKLSSNGQLGKTEYASQALARAAGMELMKKNNNILEIKVVAKVVRENGNDAVVSLKRVVRSATAKVIVSYVKVKTDTPRSNGWLVAFDYHH